MNIISYKLGVKNIIVVVGNLIAHSGEYNSLNGGKGTI